MGRKTKGFPQSIWVALERDGQDTFMVASETPEENAVRHDRRVVAEYRLGRVAIVVNETRVESVTQREGRDGH